MISKYLEGLLCFSHLAAPRLDDKTIFSFFCCRSLPPYRHTTNMKDSPIFRLILAPESLNSLSTDSRICDTNHIRWNNTHSSERDEEGKKVSLGVRSLRLKKRKTICRFCHLCFFPLAHSIRISLCSTRLLLGMVIYWGVGKLIVERSCCRFVFFCFSSLNWISSSNTQ